MIETLHILSRVLWMEDVRLKNSLRKLHTWFSHGYLLPQKSLLRSALTPILEGRIKNLGIDKRLYWTENKMNVSLELVFLYILRAALKYIYITWFGYLKIPENFTKRSETFHSKSNDSITLGRMFLRRSKPGDINDQKMRKRMYWAIRSQKNINKCI